MAIHPDAAALPDTPRNRGDDDAPHLSPATPAEDQRTILLNEIAWGAVLAGVVVALVTQLLLNMLGLGIGIATFDPGTGDNPSATSLSIGAGIWWTLSGIIASLVGGYAAGRLSGRPKEATAAWHGLTAWAFTTLVIFYLLSSTVGGVLGGVYNTVSGALGGLGRTAATTASAAAPALSQMADPFAAIETSVRDAAAAMIRQLCATPRSPLSARRSPAIRHRRNKHASGPRRRSPGRRTSRSRRPSAKSPATSSSTGRRSTRPGSRQPRPPMPPHAWSRAGRCSASSPWRWAHWRRGSAGVRARSIRP